MFLIGVRPHSLSLSIFRCHTLSSFPIFLSNHCKTENLYFNRFECVTKRLRLLAFILVPSNSFLPHAFCLLPNRIECFFTHAKSAYVHKSLHSIQFHRAKQPYNNNKISFYAVFCYIFRPPHPISVALPFISSVHDRSRFRTLRSGVASFPSFVFWMRWSLSSLFIVLFTIPKLDLCFCAKSTKFIYICLAPDVQYFCLSLNTFSLHPMTGNGNS